MASCDVLTTPISMPQQAFVEFMFPNSHLNLMISWSPPRSKRLKKRSSISSPWSRSLWCDGHRIKVIDLSCLKALMSNDEPWDCTSKFPRIIVGRNPITWNGLNRGKGGWDLFLTDAYAEFSKPGVLIIALPGRGIKKSWGVTCI